VSAIAMLWRDEPLMMDPERLAGIYVEMGEVRAQAAVSCAMEELAVTMEQVRALRIGGRPRSLEDLALRVRDIAEPLGLSSLAQVAGDLAAIAAGGDPAALGAVMARLERVSNRSLKMVWDLQDLSG